MKGKKTLYCIFGRSDDHSRRRLCVHRVRLACLQIGPEIVEISDREILELHYECLRAQAKRVAEYKHVAVEVPLGSAQIEYRAGSDQRVPRGGVLRCLIHHDEEHQLVVEIDDQELRCRLNASVCASKTPDAIALDLLQRLVEGQEPHVRETFAGLSVAAVDLADGMSWLLGWLGGHRPERKAVLAVMAKRLKRPLDY
jgi:hypothetical protein